MSGNDPTQPFDPNRPQGSHPVPPPGGPASSGAPTSAYSHPGAPTPTGPGLGSDPAGQTKGFLGALFDFSFTHFVTPMLVKFVYLLATVLLVIGYLVLSIGMLADNVATGLLFLFIIGPIGLIIYLAITRMTLEFYLAITRMSQDINQRLPRA